MTIQLTGEMMAAAKARLAPNGCTPTGLVRALTDVLALVERDYMVAPKAGTEPVKCSLCGHDNRYEIRRAGTGRHYCNDIKACALRYMGAAKGDAA